MVETPKRNAVKSAGERIVSSVAIRTLSVNEAIGDALRAWSAKAVARRLKTSTRTVEAWREGRSGPQAKHFVAMLQDDELAPALLAACGRGDLATKAEIESLNRRIEALKAAEARHKDENHAIRRDLAMGRQHGGVAGGPAQPGGDALAAGRGVVPRSDE